MPGEATVVLTLEARARLNNGVEMPYLGLGVYGARAGGEAEAAVRTALDAGYRLIDTAKLYGNEADVGKAVRESGVPRDEVFVTTKLWNSDHGYDETLRACQRSLRDLGLAYVDLYLVHWPVAGRRRETWKAMEALYAKGWARAIGVSNYMPRHLEELLAEADVVPAVDQIELHPFLPQKEVLAACRAHGILPEAYSPLTKGRRLADPGLATVARKHGKSAAQVLIRWGLEQGAAVIPKSVKPERIRENREVFDFALDATDLRELGSLQDNRHSAWDPAREP